MEHKSYLLKFAIVSIALHLLMLTLLSSVEISKNVSISLPDEYQTLQVTLNSPAKNLMEEKSAQANSSLAKTTKTISKTAEKSVPAISAEINTAQINTQKFPQLAETTIPEDTTDQETKNSHKDSQDQKIKIASLQSRHAMIKDRLDALVKRNFNYPRFAVRRGWQGTVELALRIEANGRLSNLRVVKTSGYQILDQAALTTLAKTSYISDIEAWLAGNPFDTILPVKYQLIDG